MSDQIVALYSQGLSCKSIGEIVGLCDETVRKHLIVSNISRRPQSFRAPMPVPSWEEYFSNRVEASGDCLLWNGSRDDTGYGRCSAAFAPGIHFSHRLSWFLKNGPFKLNMRILHRCDTPPCVNPEHLWVGTQSENIAAMVTKGRQRGGTTLGEKHHSAVLTDNDVRSMRSIRQANGTPYHELASEFGVTTMTAYRACTGKSWTHI